MNQRPVFIQRLELDHDIVNESPKRRDGDAVTEAFTFFGQ